MAQIGGSPTMEGLRAQRDSILEIAARRGARNIRIFGSVARGEAQADSDIDFLADFEPGRNALDLSELMLDLEEALGRKVDVVESGRVPALAEQIEREAVPL